MKPLTSSVNEEGGQHRWRRERKDDSASYEEPEASNGIAGRHEISFEALPRSTGSRTLFPYLLVQPIEVPSCPRYCLSFPSMRSNSTTQ